MRFVGKACETSSTPTTHTYSTIHPLPIAHSVAPYTPLDLYPLDLCWLDLSPLFHSHQTPPPSLLSTSLYSADPWPNDSKSVSGSLQLALCTTDGSL